MLGQKPDKYTLIGELNLMIEENKYEVTLFGNSEKTEDVNRIISRLIEKETRKY